MPVSFWVGARVSGHFGYGPRDAKWNEAVAKYRSYVLAPTPIRTILPLELYAKTSLKPALLDVCRETRSLGLYEKMILTPGSSASYAWVNYDVDIIEIEEGHEYYLLLENCGSRIRRLRLKVDLTDEGWSRGCAGELRATFTQLIECFVIMKGDARIWHWRPPQVYSLIPCAPNQIHLMDERTNEQMTCAELSRMTDEEIAEWVERIRAMGENIFDDSDDSE